ncbi:LuxR family transcriptional regulator [Rhodomicrobium sp. Az07]|nr:LuxR family transcriptional regulator [Rhodomicrobium sp. Az07]
MVMDRFAIERFIEDANAAKSSKEVSELFGKALAVFGYDRYCYSLITDHPSVGLNAVHGIVCNYPDDWMEHYRINQYEKKDPVPQYGVSASRPFTWASALANRKWHNDQMKVMHEAEEARLCDGIAVPVCGVNGELAGFGIASSHGGVNPDRALLHKVQALAIQFHLAFTELEKIEVPLTEGLGDVYLTEREKEIMCWAAEGKSDSVIADILGVSHSTVRFHMNNVFKKLNANERTLATVKAIRHGLILPSFIG